MKKEPGHRLLERLGKTKLRPGGLQGTNWLLEHINFEKSIVMLEVACNKGVDLIGIAENHEGIFYGVDKDKVSVEKAKKNVKLANLEKKINIQYADATELPFEDNFFDVVINEAMLTMLSNELKTKAVKEYLRVLKPGGILLTHDVLLKKMIKILLKICKKLFIYLLFH